jgi:hypothetical protein
VLKTAAFTGDLEHWHYDTFRVIWREKMLGKAFINFTLDPQGKVESLRIPDQQLTFKRSVEAAPPAEAVAVSEADLKRLVGKYVLESAPVEVSIEIVGGKLKATVPGQPVYTLIPVSAVRYQIEGAPAGYFINFDVAGGKVSGMTIEQGPAVSLKLKPKQ